MLGEEGPRGGGGLYADASVATGSRTGPASSRARRAPPVSVHEHARREEVRDGGDEEREAARDRHDGHLDEPAALVGLRVAQGSCPADVFSLR